MECNRSADPKDKKLTLQQVSGSVCVGGCVWGGVGVCVWRGCVVGVGVQCLEE